MKPIRQYFPPPPSKFPAIWYTILWRLWRLLLCDTTGNLYNFVFIILACAWYSPWMCDNTLAWPGVLLAQGVITYKRPQKRSRHLCWYCRLCIPYKHTICSQSLFQQEVEARTLLACDQCVTLHTLAHYSANLLVFSFIKTYTPLLVLNSQILSSRYTYRLEIISTATQTW